MNRSRLIAVSLAAFALGVIIGVGVMINRDPFAPRPEQRTIDQLAHENEILHKLVKELKAERQEVREAIEQPDKSMPKGAIIP